MCRLAAAGGDGVQQREKGGGLADLSAEHKARLVVQPSPRVEHGLVDVAHQVGARVVGDVACALGQRFHVDGDSPADRVQGHHVVEREAERFIEVGKTEGAHAHLAGPPSVEGRVIGQRAAVHHAHQRAAEDQHQVLGLELRVPQALQDRGKGLIYLDQGLELVEDEDDLLPPVGALDKLAQDPIPVGRRDLGQQIIPHKAGHGGQQALHERRFHRPVGQVKDARLALAKAGQCRRLAHPPPPVDDKEVAARLLVLFFQEVQFVLAIPEGCLHFSVLDLSG